MTPTNPKYETKCRMCGQVFSHTAIDVPIIGQPKNARPERLVKFVMALASHLHQKHQNETTQQMGTAIQDYSGLLIVNSYETTDPGLLRLTDAIRADVHRKTQKNFVSDEALDQLLARVATLDDDQRKIVKALLTGLRDAYEEIGDYSPEKAEKLIVTA